MMQGVRTVRPALDKFYESLNDEQKARFSASAPTIRTSSRLSAT